MERRLPTQWRDKSFCVTHNTKTKPFIYYLTSAGCFGLGFGLKVVLHMARAEWKYYTFVYGSNRNA